MNALPSQVAIGTASVMRINRQNTSAMDVTVDKGQVIRVAAKNHGMTYCAAACQAGWYVVRYRHDGTLLGAVVHYPSLLALAQAVPVFAALPALLKMGCYQRSGAART